MHQPFRSCRSLFAGQFLLFCPFSIRILFQALLWLTFLLGFTQLTTAQIPSLFWQKTLGGSNLDDARASTAISDGGYVVAGSTESNDGDVTGFHGQTDFWIVRLDSDHNKIWQKTLGGTGYDDAFAITTTPDGGFVVAGRTNSINGDVTDSHGLYDFWVVKLDGMGNLVWQKSFGGTKDDHAYAITASPDGGFVVAGTSQSNDGDVTGNQNPGGGWIIKLDGAGNLLWQKTFQGAPNAIIVSADGGYVVAGSTSNTTISGFQGNIDYWVAKLDGSGNLLWQKALGGTSVEFAYAITNSQDGGYVIAGWTISNDRDVTNFHGIGDYWVVKLDGAGNFVWQKTLGGTNGDYAFAIIATSDGGYLIAGQTLSTDGDVTDNHGNADYWLVKLNGTGNLVWQKTLGGTNNDYAFGLISSPDGSFVVVGSTESNNGDVTGNQNHGASDFWVVRMGTTASITGLRANPNPVCAGKPLLLTASIGNVTGNYSYSITNGTGVNLQGTNSTQGISQTLIASGSGSQSFTLTVTNTLGSTSSFLSVTVNGDGNCSIPTPCASVHSGDWSSPATWLCGHEPTVNDLAIINPGHVVVISTNSAQAHRISNNGTMQYASAGAKVFIKGD